MTYSALAAPRTYNRAAVSTPAISVPKLSKLTMHLTLACLLGLLYLVQVTHTNAYGYKLNEFQAESAKLQSEHDALVLQNAQYQSLDRVQNYADAEGMVQPNPQ